MIKFYMQVEFSVFFFRQKARASDILIEIIALLMVQFSK